MARYTGPAYKKARRLNFSLLENGKETAKRPGGAIAVSMVCLVVCLLNTNRTKEHPISGMPFLQIRWTGQLTSALHPHAVYSDLLCY